MTAPKFSQLRFYLFVFRIVDIDIYEIFDLLDGVLNLLDSRARDVGVQWFVETIVKLPGLRQACHARPNGPLSSNDNRAIRLLLELLDLLQQERVLLHLAQVLLLVDVALLLHLALQRGHGPGEPRGNQLTIASCAVVLQLRPSPLSAFVKSLACTRWIQSLYAVHELLCSDERKNPSLDSNQRPLGENFMRTITFGVSHRRK